VTKKTPPAYGLSDGPMMVACQWNISSATGPVDVPTQAHFSQTDQNSSLNASFETLWRNYNTSSTQRIEGACYM
jgi:hypothetical protein